MSGNDDDNDRDTPLSAIRVFDSPINFSRELCGNLAAAEQREWLVTNGMGGFASGTVAGLLTRRYHGLLVAALKPPVGRTLLVSKIDEIVDYQATTFALGANRWRDGAMDPHGYQFIESFRLEGTTPVWTFACADALLEKRIWMERGANTTYVSYQLLRARSPFRLTLKVLVNYRDFHGITCAGDWRMDIQPTEHGLRVVAFQDARPFYVRSPEAALDPTHIWYRNYDLAVERSRGLEDCEDHLHAATCSVALAAGGSATPGSSRSPGDSLTLVLSTEPAPDLNVQPALERHIGRERSLLHRWNAAHSSLTGATPPGVQQFVLAADQFVVQRTLAPKQQASSVIAGYHWFGDWGRDTMVALPGLTLTTGRADVTKDILQTFAKFVSEGMLPNTFPESGAEPEYNTVDAALWYFEALRQYIAATGDTETLRDLFPALTGIIGKYIRGTRFNIHVDRMDGLLYAGAPGVALTWMDAKVGDQAVTPRIGKTVEVNALWINALLAMARFANRLKKPSTYYENMAARAREGFERFWNAEANCCFDVLDGPEGSDPAFRPNQIFAVSLAESLLAPERMRAVVDACEKHLLTPRGLRSLSPDSPQYRARCAGPARERDDAYHQGTVWGWLLGPFALAHLRVYRDPARAEAFLEPLINWLTEYGVGTAGEIFDGDAPFAPRGCIAQAWTVAELLRAWTEIQKAKLETAKLKARSMQ